MTPCSWRQAGGLTIKTTVKLWWGIAVLIILSPLGLILPARLKAGAAWGEWGLEEIQKLAGYIPRGMAKWTGLWSAPLADYGFGAWAEKGLPRLSLTYIISAALWIIVV